MPNEIPEHMRTGPRLNVDRISPPDLHLVRMIVRRAVRVVRDYRAGNPRDGILEPDPQIIAMDICTVHLTRGLNLNQFFLLPVDLFLMELATIAARVDRTCAFFPADAYLRCADSTRIPTGNQT